MKPVSRASRAAPTPDGEPAASAARRAALPLALGALGVVFGDIGTSPLYALQTVFSIDNNAVRPVPVDVYGVISLVFWSILIIVSVKYVAFMLRADNDGEGGIMALAALIRRRVTDRRVVAIAVLLGMFGAALFFGDSVITPAISVLSAVEGIVVVSPGVQDAVLPIGAGIVVVLFMVQRFGTHNVGRLFGPVMLLWFTVIAVLGLPGRSTFPRSTGCSSPPCCSPCSPSGLRIGWLPRTAWPSPAPCCSPRPCFSSWPAGRGTGAGGSCCWRASCSAGWS